MKIAALHIPSGQLPFLFGSAHDAIVINLGGKNIYSISQNEIIATPNDFYIEDLFKSNISLLSCIVGKNGGGKTTLLRTIMNSYDCTYILEDENGKYAEANDIEHIHRIYYTPYLHHKTFDYVRDNGKDLSKYTLLILDNQGDNASLVDFLDSHHSENIKRWIKFNNFFKNNQDLKIHLPVFEKVELDLRHFEADIHNPGKFNDTSYQLRSAISLIFSKIKSEQQEQEGQIEDSTIRKKMVYLTRFKYELLENALGKIVSILERAGNHYLEEGDIDENFEEVISSLTAQESIQWFLMHTGVHTKTKRYSFSQHSVLMDLIDYILSITTEKNLTDNWRKIILNEEQALRVIELYDEFNNSFINEWFKFDTTPMFRFIPDIIVSSGEQSFLNLFSTLFYHSQNIKNGVENDFHSFHSLSKIGKDILIMIDEGDNAFHPQWKKEYVLYLRKVMPIIFKDYNIQIIITSHDPLTLSDIPKNSVVFLETINGNTSIGSSEDKKTLGANIYDLMKDSFFIQDGQIGSFISGVIQKVIQTLQNRDITQTKKNELRRIIQCIDEPIIRFKLAEMFSEATEDKSFELQILDNEIKRLQGRRDSL